MDTQWALGLVLLGAVVVLWIASGFLVNAMSTDYAKPYFITYLNTSLMVLYLPLGLRKHKTPDTASSPVVFTRRQTLKLSLEFGFLWFLSNLLNNASYQYTTVQSSTILSCTSSFFTFLIGSWFGVEKFSLSKLWPLIVAGFGVVLISNQDDQEVTAPPHALIGNILALGSAMLYGVYTTLLKYKVGDESNLNTKLFFGYVGMINIVALWPLVLLLHVFDIEPIELPPNSSVWLMLVANAIIILISDFCWVLAMLMTSPLVVTVGLSATIPLSMLGEMVLYKRIGSVVYFIGAAMVGYGFLIINKEEEEDKEPGYSPALHANDRPFPEALTPA